MNSQPRLFLLAGRGNGAPSDADLARALIREEIGAERAAWQRFLPAVRGNLRRVLGPLPDQDDLTQDVFLRFFQRIQTLRDPEAVRGFLFAICVRVARKELRRKWLKRWLRLTPSGEVPEPEVWVEPEETEREAKAAVTRYYEILDAIGGQGRSLFVTRYIEGLDLATVAELHELSISTTQRRLVRVEKRIDAMVRGDALLREFIQARKAVAS